MFDPLVVVSVATDAPEPTQNDCELLAVGVDGTLFTVKGKLVEAVHPFAAVAVTE